MCYHVGGPLGQGRLEGEFVAHSRGWSAEDMERNVIHVRNSAELREGAKELTGRAVEMALLLLARDKIIDRTARGGRKAHKLEVKA